MKQQKKNKAKLNFEFLPTDELIRKYNSLYKFKHTIKSKEDVFFK